MWNMADISVADVIKSSLQQKLLMKYNIVLRSTNSNSYGFIHSCWTQIWTLFEVNPTLLDPFLDLEGQPDPIQPEFMV